MSDEPNEEKVFIIPGQEKTGWSEWISDRNQAYWFVKCPDCGGIHPRIVTEYWQIETQEQGGFTSHKVSQHCFTCEVVGRHYRIDWTSPFVILGEIPVPVMKVLEPEADDEELKRKFE